jgi:biopolymer transport protein ExbD
LETLKPESIGKGLFERLNEGRRRSFGLRMAPMIDIIFLLLIFFLVTSRWRPAEDFLPFRLPAAKAKSYSIGKPEPLLIRIFATESGCRVQIGQAAAVQIEKGSIEQDLTALMAEISEYMSEQKRFADDPVEIVCAAKVKWQYLAKIYNMFYGAGLTDITFTMTE